MVIFHINTDSHRILDKLNSVIGYPTAPSSMTMNAGWDMFSALNKTLDVFPTWPVTEWVGIHQDDSSDNTLSHSSQLVYLFHELAIEGHNFLNPNTHIPFDRLSNF